MEGGAVNSAPTTSAPASAPTARATQYGASQRLGRGPGARTRDSRRDGMGTRSITDRVNEGCDQQAGCDGARRRADLAASHSAMASAPAATKTSAAVPIASAPIRCGHEGSCSTARSALGACLPISEGPAGSYHGCDPAGPPGCVSRLAAEPRCAALRRGRQSRCLIVATSASLPAASASVHQEGDWSRTSRPPAARAALSLGLRQLVRQPDRDVDRAAASPRGSSIPSNQKPGSDRAGGRGPPRGCARRGS